jgi:hypothetical protein
MAKSDEVEAGRHCLFQLVGQLLILNDDSGVLRPKYRRHRLIAASKSFLSRVIKLLPLHSMLRPYWLGK